MDKSATHYCRYCTRRDEYICGMTHAHIALSVETCKLAGWRPAQRISDYSQRGTDDGVEFPLIDTRHTRYEPE